MRGLKKKEEAGVSAEGVVGEEEEEEEERLGLLQGWSGGYMTVFERAARMGRGEWAWRRCRAGKM